MARGLSRRGGRGHVRPLNPAYSARIHVIPGRTCGASAVIVQAGLPSPARDVARASGLRIMELSPDRGRGGSLHPRR